MVSFLTFTLTKTREQVQQPSVLPSFHPPTLLLVIRDNIPVVLKVWVPGQQEQHYLGTHQKCNFLGPHPKPTESEQLRMHPEICVLTSLGDSAAQM